MAQSHSGQARLNAFSTPAKAGQFYAHRARIITDLKLSSGETASVKVAGVGGLPASGIESVALNVAVRDPNGRGEYSIYPADGSEPKSQATYSVETYRHELLIVKPGPSGYVKITARGRVGVPSSDTVTFYIDVHGYTLASAGASPGSTFMPLKPTRIERISIPANGTYDLALGGRGGVPASGASHAAITIATKGTAAGKVKVYGTGAVEPADTNLDYGTADYLENHVFAKIGDSGRVRFKNVGTAAIGLDVDVYGYFASPQAAVTGATIHPVYPARLVAGATVAAKGTYILAPLGKSGIPANGVSGVFVNIHVGSTNELIEARGRGAMRVYPSGTPYALTHAVATWPGYGVANNSSVSAKLGADGKLAIYNDTAEQVFMAVDVYAYYKDPVRGCVASASAKQMRTTAAADLEVEQDSRVTAVQQSPVAGASKGPISYAFTDNRGYLRHGFQPDPGSFATIHWSPLSGTDQAFTGQPALAEQEDGRLQVLANNTSGSLWYRTQENKNLAPWLPWVNTGGVLTRATLARHDDSLVAFAIDGYGGGGLWAMPQFGANDPYREYFYLGLSGLSTKTTPVAVQARSGLRVFVLDTQGVWRTAVYANGVLSDCTSISEPGFSGELSAVTLPGGIAQIFVRQPDGRIVTKRQDANGNFPQGWSQVGTGDFASLGSPAALVDPRSGKLRVLARNADKKIVVASEVTLGSDQWGTWNLAHAGGGDDAATDPTVLTFDGTNGLDWVYVVRNAANEVRPLRVDEDALTSRSGVTPKRSAGRR
ncbi:hypothetical protein GCM10010411_41860 [Actinomadura fulvescens]|uniref:PLL-like beta propeller domain-containing protein n=1 Tax=Actinomadura fulvescens TaxID=46160 RepID=A0ABN3PW72_9ACTN